MDEWRDPVLRAKCFVALSVRNGSEPSAATWPPTSACLKPFFGGLHPPDPDAVGLKQLHAAGGAVDPGQGAGKLFPRVYGSAGR